MMSALLHFEFDVDNTTDPLIPESAITNHSICFLKMVSVRIWYFRLKLKVRTRVKTVGGLISKKEPDMQKKIDISEAGLYCY